MHMVLDFASQMASKCASETVDIIQFNNKTIEIVEDQLWYWGGDGGVIWLYECAAKYLLFHKINVKTKEHCQENCTCTDCC